MRKKNRTKKLREKNVMQKNHGGIRDDYGFSQKKAPRRVRGNTGVTAS